MVLRAGAGLLVALVLGGCQPAGGGSSSASSKTPAPAPVAIPAEQAEPSPEPKAAVNDPLEVVKQFDLLCYGTNGNPAQIARMVEAMDLKAAPPELMEMMSSGRGDQGKAYILEFNQEAERLMVVGVGDNGTCSVYAGGFAAASVEAALKENFKLLEVAADQVGMQTMTMHVPGGTSNRLSEAHQKGVVSIVRSKDASGDNEILIGFIPPELAKATLN